MRSRHDDSERKVHAALTRAMELLDSAVADQEVAANRILDLAERLRRSAPDRRAADKIDAIIQACTFQDITGQRIRKVERLIKYLRDTKAIDAVDLPGPAVAAPEPEPESAGLSQADVDRLLSG
jgi:chemotaxis regulatin CheY-phosphate phosphatase CheZ